MTSQSRRVSYAILVGVAVCSLVAPAQAQDTSSTQPLEITATPPEQTPVAPVNQSPPRQPYWSSVGGFETDTHGTGYGFFGPQYIKPFRPNVAFIGSANANYLFYEYDTNVGHTNVRSPGMSLMGGVMFGSRNWFSLQAGPSFKRRHRKVFDLDDNLISSEKDIHTGVNLGASLWVDPTSHNNVFGMLNYDAVDDYTWGRIAFKEQIANRSWQGGWTPYLGAEYIGQGNVDIHSHQYGPFFELAHARSSISVMVRGGYKQSSFQFGPDKTGPWFAIGFYHRLR